MSFNGIDLRNHEEEPEYDEGMVKRVIHYDYVASRIVEFINRTSTETKVVVGGHNTSFDTGFIKKAFENSDYDYGKFFSYREVDTAAVIKYLKHVGYVTKDVKSLDDALEYFGMEIPSRERHTGIGDAKATANLYSLLTSFTVVNVI
jgi:DNA polymerase III epsilon subunit-like protein